MMPSAYYLRNGSYYLNNRGDKWIIYEFGRRISQTWQTASGKTVTRRVQYFEAFGNFALCAIYYKGKLIKVFADSVLED